MNTQNLPRRSLHYGLLDITIYADYFTLSVSDYTFCKLPLDKYEDVERNFFKQEDDSVRNVTFPKEYVTLSFPKGYKDCIPTFITVANKFDRTCNNGLFDRICNFELILDILQGVRYHDNIEDLKARVKKHKATEIYENTREAFKVINIDYDRLINGAIWTAEKIEADKAWRYDVIMKNVIAGYKWDPSYDINWYKLATDGRVNEIDDDHAGWWREAEEAGTTFVVLHEFSSEAFHKNTFGAFHKNTFGASPNSEILTPPLRRNLRRNHRVRTQPPKKT